MTGLFALFCTLLVVGGLFLTQVILLQNSQQWGNQLARQCPEEDAVLAFATSLKSENGLALPKGSSYYLCDAQGQLLYARTEFSADPQRLSGYIHTIFQQIKAGQLDDAKEYVYGHERFILPQQKTAGCPSSPFPILPFWAICVRCSMAPVPSAALSFHCFCSSVCGNDWPGGKLSGLLKQWPLWATCTMPSIGSMWAVEAMKSSKVPNMYSNSSHPPAPMKT